MNTRTKLKELSRDNQTPPRKELDEVELDLITGGKESVRPHSSTCPNTCLSPYGSDDD